MNHVKIAEKKIVPTKNPVARHCSPVTAKEIYLRICKDSKDTSPTSSIREKDINKGSNQTIIELV